MPQRRFLLLLPGNGYYAHMAAALREGLLENGAAAELFPIPTPRMLGGLDAEGLRRAVAAFRPTDTLSVNVAKRLLPLPPQVVHHCWVQDPYDAAVERGGLGDRTWMWIHHWIPWYGGSWLPPATDFGRYRTGAPPHFAADVSFAGILPAFLIQVEGNARVNQALRRLIDAMSAELRATARFFCDRRYAEDLLDRAERATGEALSGALREEMLYHVRNRLFRHVQRRRLMEALVPVCRRRGWTLRLAGHNWEGDPAFKPFAVGNLPPGEPLARFFQSSRVNLQMNGDTNVHGRVLECLAAGAFVLSEAHVTDGQAGGLRSILDERSAPTFDGLRDLEEKLAAFIGDDRLRREAADAGGAAVRARHTYRERAASLLSPPEG